MYLSLYDRDLRHERGKETADENLNSISNYAIFCKHSAEYRNLNTYLQG